MAVLTPGAVLAAGSVPQGEPKPEFFDSNSLLGSYLAGRLARSARDSESAALYYQRALSRDPGNQDILDDAFQLELAAGNFDSARSLAQRLLQRQKDNTIAHLFLGLQAFKKRDYARAGESFKAAEKGSAAGEPTVKLAKAWLAVAEGKIDKAISALESPSKAAWATHFETVQRAFIADVGKKREIAERALQTLYEKKPPNTRIAEAYARHLAHYGNVDRAKAVLSESGADLPPMGRALLAEITAGKTPNLMVATAEEGLGEVFLGIGQVLASNNGVDAAQIYLRLALFLNPNSDIAQIELADIYGGVEQYEKAVALFSGIGLRSPFYLNAQIRKALNLNALKKTDEAITLLAHLSDKYPKETTVLETLASLESARKKFDAAIPYYDRAIALASVPEKKHWQLFYNRGICYERTKEWPKAEADFKKSLELDPEQAATLNYLGYSWLDHNINVAEGFDLVKKAVRMRPNDGYIVDSLGWGHYLQRNYEEAVKQLDRAVELRPEDPTLNDHLGDVYWRLGRRLEAQYQWYQALTLNPEPEDAIKIKKKADEGLPDDEQRPSENGAGSTAQAAPQTEGNDAASAR